MAHRGEIMIVDDTPANLQLLAGLLEDEGYMVRPTRVSEMAIESAQADPPNLILLDIMMPSMDGFEVCRQLKQNESTADIPIIFITALHETEDRLRGFELGGVDFITKPIRRADVLARVSAQLVLYQMGESRKEAFNICNKELHENESKYKSVFETSDDAIMLLNEKTICFDCNSSALNLFGYKSSKKLIGLQLDELSPLTQLDGQASREDINEMIELTHQKHTHSFESIFCRSSGEHFPAEILLTCLSLRGKKMIQATIWDVSKRKRIELALKKNEERLQVIGAGTADSVLLSDEDVATNYNDSSNKTYHIH
ncbi:MAG: hypothetical protein CMF45_01810 [Legionellales bacterium]|nr:hypothetical protein [Legionellales bacterium]|tara:strand:- start:488 stop:1426 length:939 start_codon:yes stop_codon:yes gene_type:complete